MSCENAENGPFPVEMAYNGLQAIPLSKVKMSGPKPNACEENRIGGEYCSQNALRCAGMSWGQVDGAERIEQTMGFT